MDNKYLKEYKGWIPVYMALPDTPDDVLCVVEEYSSVFVEDVGYTDATLFIGYYDEGEWYFRSGEPIYKNDVVCLTVKYWMYLPDLPDEYKDSTIEE